MPTARSGDNLIVSLLLNPSQRVSHFETPNTTQLGGCQLAPMTFEGDELVLQLLHGGGEATIAMDFRLKRWVVAVFDGMVDMGALVVPPVKEGEVFFGIDRAITEGEDGVRIQRHRVDVVQPIHQCNHHGVTTHDGLDVLGVLH